MTSNATNSVMNPVTQDAQAARQYVDYRRGSLMQLIKRVKVKNEVGLADAAMVGQRQARAAVQTPGEECRAGQMILCIAADVVGSIKA